MMIHTASFSELYYNERDKIGQEIYFAVTPVLSEVYITFKGSTFLPLLSDMLAVCCGCCYKVWCFERFLASHEKSFQMPSVSSRRARPGTVETMLSLRIKTGSLFIFLEDGYDNWGVQTMVFVWIVTSNQFIHLHDGHEPLPEL